MKYDLLKVSKWMAIGAIGLCSVATLIAYFGFEAFNFFTLPLLISGVLFWILSVVWFLWGWLKNANEVGNERKGISASSYILVFLPICYLYLMATDRTLISVNIENRFKDVHSVMVYGEGTIFSKPDTVKLPKLAKGGSLKYEIKAGTAPHMRGEIIFEGTLGNSIFRKRVAGPFSIQPLFLKQDWKVRLNEDFFSED